MPDVFPLWYGQPKLVHVGVEGRAIPEYVIRIGVTPGVWWQDNGHPGFVDFAIYGVVGYVIADPSGAEKPGEILIEKVGDDGMGGGTTVLDDGHPTIAGSVKWDGCTDYATTDGLMAHACDAGQLDALARALCRAYAECVEIVAVPENLR